MSMDKHKARQRKHRFVSLPTFVAPGEVAFPIDVLFLVDVYRLVMEKWQKARLRHASALALAAFIIERHVRQHPVTLEETVKIVGELARDMVEQFGQASAERSSDGGPTE